MLYFRKRQRREETSGSAETGQVYKFFLGTAKAMEVVAGLGFAVIGPDADSNADDHTDFKERLRQSKTCVIGAGYKELDYERWSAVDPYYIGVHGYESVKEDPENDRIKGNPIRPFDWNEGPPNRLATLFTRGLIKHKFENMFFDRDTLVHIHREMVLRAFFMPNRIEKYRFFDNLFIPKVDYDNYKEGYAKKIADLERELADLPNTDSFRAKSMQESKMQFTQSLVNLETVMRFVEDPTSYTELRVYSPGYDYGKNPETGYDVFYGFKIIRPTK